MNLQWTENGEKKETDWVKNKDRIKKKSIILRQRTSMGGFIGQSHNFSVVGSRKLNVASD